MKRVFQNNNSIMIKGWMVNDLNLSGNELIVYALIFGFSQDGESEFYGSLSYIGSAINASKPTVIKVINSLVEKDLVFKNQNSMGGIIVTKYRANLNCLDASKETLQGVKKEEIASKETLFASKETLHNNNIYNNKENNNTQTLISDNSLKTNKKEKRETKLFVDSIWNDFEAVKKHFISKPDLLQKYAYCDLKYYINKVDIWSENSGTKRTDRGWIGTIIDFIDKAKIAGNMQLIDKPKQQQGHINY